jgi:hypothetical protein
MLGCGLPRIDILGTRVNRRTNMLRGAVGGAILIALGIIIVIGVLSGGG